MLRQGTIWAVADIPPPFLPRGVQRSDSCESGCPSAHDCPYSRQATKHLLPPGSDLGRGGSALSGRAGYLLHIRDVIDRALAYTESGREEFFAASMIQDAVMRNLEIVGEAAKRVDLDLVWDIVASELPAVRTQIITLLEELKPGEDLGAA
ncbi:MAG TPA: HepT-like ribonuclease domain-containing protein [Solirubrobacterales bacterium]|nr:HepT-like ribonuclease domain-containing protein [Solirubrobacterales bacterium]